MPAVSGETIVEAVRLANIVRAVGEPEPPRRWFGLRKGKRKNELQDLPPALPSEPQACLLAKAFNFGCKVYRAEAGLWFVLFPLWKKEYAEALLQEVRDDTGQEELINFGLGLDDGWRVDLPKHIGKIAAAFDHKLLPEKYYLHGK